MSRPDAASGGIGNILDRTFRQLNTAASTIAGVKLILNPSQIRVDPDQDNAEGGRVLVFDTIMRECGISGSDLLVSRSVGCVKDSTSYIERLPTFVFHFLTATILIYLWTAS